MERDQASLESVLSEIASLREEIGDSQRLRADLEAALDRKGDSLRHDMRHELERDIVSHREYIMELYTKFERIALLALGLVAAVVSYLGYNQYSAFPDQMRQVIETVAKDEEDEIKSQKRDVALKLRAQHDDMEKSLNAFKADANALSTDLKALFEAERQKAIAGLTASFQADLDKLRSDVDLAIVTGSGDSVSQAMSRLLRAVSNLQFAEQVTLLARIADVRRSEFSREPLIAPQLSKVLDGWLQDNSATDLESRATSLRVAAMVGHKPTIDKLAAWLDPNANNPDMIEGLLRVIGNQNIDAVTVKAHLGPLLASSNTAIQWRAFGLFTVAPIHSQQDLATIAEFIRRASERSSIMGIWAIVPRIPPNAEILDAMMDSMEHGLTGESKGLMAASTLGYLNSTFDKGGFESDKVTKCMELIDKAITELDRGDNEVLSRVEAERGMLDTKIEFQGSEKYALVPMDRFRAVHVGDRHQTYPPDQALTLRDSGDSITSVDIDGTDPTDRTVTITLTVTPKGGGANRSVKFALQMQGSEEAFVGRSSERTPELGNLAIMGTQRDVYLLRKP